MICTFFFFFFGSFDSAKVLITILTLCICFVLVHKNIETSSINEEMSFWYACTLKDKISCHMWWCTLIVPATVEAEAGGVKIQGQTEQFSKTLSRNLKTGDET